MTSRPFDDQQKVELILGALAEVVYEVGTEGLTVALIIDRAKVSRSAFYRLFENCQDALARAVTLASRSIRADIEATTALGTSGAAYLEQVILVLLSAVAKKPALAALCFLYPYADPEVQEPFHPVLVDALTTAMRAGGGESPATQDAPVAAEEFIAFGMLSIIAERLRRRETEDLETLGGELTELSLTYLHPTKTSARGG